MMNEVRIFQPTKNAMQSGRANSRKWVLEYEPTEARRADPLMGWISSGDMENSQVRLRFASKEEAIAFADKKGLAYQVAEPKRRTFKPKNYSNNFSSRFRFE